jgi:hypothetical protein
MIPAITLPVTSGPVKVVNLSLLRRRRELQWTF